MRERRAAERQPFVRPVEIALGRNRDVVMKAMSNTISHLGIGVVHDVPIDVGRIAVLTILRMHETPLRVRAECRWCNEYSSQWYASGWKFIAEEQ